MDVGRFADLRKAICDGAADAVGRAIARHEFDALPTAAGVEARPATRAEIPAVAEMAQRIVPEVRLDAQGLLRHHLHDPDSIFVFRQSGRLLGGVAFLYLNARGHQAMLAGEFLASDPDFSLLAQRDAPVAAIYGWAVGATGRGVSGLGQTAARLREPRYRKANMYARPTSAAGRRLMLALGYRPIAGSATDLWCYERPWNRSSDESGAPRLPAERAFHA